MKNFLVVFDDLNYSGSLAKFAIELSRTKGGFIRAAFINPLVFSSDAYPFPNDLPLASDEFKFSTLKQDAENQLNQAHIAQLRHGCQEAGIGCHIEEEAEITVEELIRQSAFADLIICEAKNRVNEVYVRELLADAHCPVLLVPEDARMPGSTVLCYDESYSSIYAMRMFSYLFPDWNELPCEVLSIIPESKDLEHENYLSEWLQVHYPQAKREIISGNLQRELISFIRDSRRTKVVVMGAYGRNAISRMFHRSLANIVIEETDALLFITHE